jgi:hypothetical protein
VDGSGLRSCPVSGFGVSLVEEISGSAVTMSVSNFLRSMVPYV